MDNGRTWLGFTMYQLLGSTADWNPWTIHCSANERKRLKTRHDKYTTHGLQTEGYSWYWPLSGDFNDATMFLSLDRGLRTMSTKKSQRTAMKIRILPYHIQIDVNWKLYNIPVFIKYNYFIILNFSNIAPSLPVGGGLNSRLFCQGLFAQSHQAFVVKFLVCRREVS